MAFENLPNGPAIVAARTHRLKFALKLTIKPVMEVAALTAQEQETLENKLEAAIKQAVATRSFVNHAGQEVGVEFVAMTRDHSNLTTEEW